MSTLYIMVGIPGAGKDYYIEHNKKDTDIVLSSDGIRAELGDVNDQSQNELVFSMLYERLEENLKAGNDVWFNATNINIKNRSRAVNMGKQYKYNLVAVVIAVPVEKAIEQDSKRDRTVGEAVIWKFVHRFEMPFREEGFNEVRIIGDNAPLNEAEIQAKMKATEQTSKWHKENVYEHCVAVDRLFNYNNKQKYVFYHDIGKIYTQTWDEEKKCYHFYDHANVGAYYLITHPIDGVIDLEGIFLVNYHMLLKKDKDRTQKNFDKWRRFLGQEKFDLLMSFADADSAGAIREGE